MVSQSETSSSMFARRWLGLIFIGISVVVISLDNTVLNTALPSIARKLSATTNEQQWILDGYVLVFAALLLTTGSIGDRWGRKKALLFGLVWFAVGSLLAALSTNTGMLILTRAALAVGSAMILPATLSIISATFPPSERPQAIAIWAAIFGLGVGIGPVLGGFLLERWDWNSVFLINIPICAIALVGVVFFLADSRDMHAPPVDLPGVVLSIEGLLLLIHGIIEAGVLGWADPDVLRSLGGGVILLAAFAWWEARSPNAMLPMRFFRNMSFTSASISLSLVTFGQFSILFLLIPYLQTVQNYSTLQSGLLVLPMALTLTAMATLSPRISRRLGVKLAVALGIGVAASGYLLMGLIFQLDTPYPLILLGQLIVGIGVGTAFSPATNSIMGSIPVDKAGIGSAMNDTTRQLGGAIGIAVLGTVLNLGYVGTLNTTSGIPASALADSSRGVQAAHLAAQTLGDPTRAHALITAADQAYLVGMHNALLVGALVLFCSSLFSYRFLPAQIRRSEEFVAQPLDGAEAIGD